MTREVLAAAVALALGGCMNGPIGAIGPGGKANAFQVDGVLFDRVRATAEGVAEGGAVRLAMEGEALERGGCAVQLVGFTIDLDLARLDEGPLPLDLDVAHTARLGADGASLVDDPDRAQPRAIRAPRWFERCADAPPAPILGQRLDGLLRLSYLDADRLEARVELEVSTTSSRGADARAVAEAFFDLALPRTSTAAAP